MDEKEILCSPHEKHPLEFVAIVTSIAIALQKLSTAASLNIGRDCYLHAVLGQALLKDAGYESRIQCGAAAWRIGEGDGDVISHIPGQTGHVPAGMKGFAYHAWLDCNGVLVDFTTYQLRQKAAELDELDGQHTNVDWCPDFLILEKRDIRSYRDVAQLHTGMAFYEALPTLEKAIANGFSLNEEDLAMARLVLASPDMEVFGPNHYRCGSQQQASR